MRIDESLPSNDEAFYRRQIDRRRFLGYTATMALGTPAVGAFLAACQSSQTSGVSSKSPKGTLVIAAAATPSGIDRDISGNPQSWECMANSMATLVDWRFYRDPRVPTALVADYGTLIPHLASSWVTSSDGLSVTFTLRQGVMSHAGNELTAEDVRWTHERALGLGAIGAFFDSVMGVTKPSQIAVVDKYRVSITSSSPNALLLKLQANEFTGILDSTEVKKHATSSDPWATTWMAQNTAGFGAYKIESLEAGRQAVFVAHDQYFLGAPQIKRVIYNAVPEPASRFALLERGDADIAYDLTPEQIFSLAGKPGLNLLNFPSNFFAYIIMNLKTKPWNDVRVRQAVNYAIPYDQVIKDALHNLARRMRGPSPDIYPCFSQFSAAFPYNTDVNRAKQLLNAAGYGSGFSTTLAYDSDQPDMAIIAPILKSGFAKVGINASLQPVAGAAFDKQLRGRQFDFVLWKEGPIVPDPDYDLRLYFDSVNGFNDYGNWDSPAFNQILDSGRAILDPQARCTHYSQAAQIVIQEAPWAFVAFTGYQVGTSASLANYKQRSLNFPEWAAFTKA